MAALAEAGGDRPIKDREQVRLLAQALAASPETELERMMTDPTEAARREEAWILGTGYAERLCGLARTAIGPQGDTDDPDAMAHAAPTADAALLAPPPLRDDCFAMPRGVDWVPVDDALARLRAALHPVTGPESVPTPAAGGRVLAEDCVARRSNPPRANAAVDGYGLAHATLGPPPHTLRLAPGRAAAGQPFAGAVPPGQAVRILTGAILPDGVDTVVLEEDTASNGAFVSFNGPVKPGANTRRAGEDVAEGAPALPAGHRLRAPDLALLSALGLGAVPVRRRLRVGVLSTGDEIVPDPAEPALPHQIWDANRPMLLSLVAGWGFTPVDLGHVSDDSALIAQRLDDGARRADAILTSGGASAGDEDHVSALLRARGTLSSWRIAVKPGRPLALALWEGRPVFGLPGNPVAALVCALIFARPALSLLSGAGWVDPQGFAVPAAFSKAKKPGRREYLRARLTAEGAAEAFRSEGSGRISGLSWATGLVELPDGAMTVEPGTPVRFLPYAALGVT
jgi:molybdopterin molybdotransferase